MKKYLLVFICISVFSSGCLGEENISQDSNQTTTSTNRIAYVNIDNQIVTTNADGTTKHQISDNGTFSWPTWSPDSKKIAYSGITKPNAYDEIGLFISSLIDKSTKKIYANNPDIPALIAPKLLHYTMWSPNSEQLMFISQTADYGLTLFLYNATDEKKPSLTLGSGPLYSSWSPNSDYLMVHRHQNHFLVDATGYSKPEELPFNSIAYRAPAWSTKGAILIVFTQELTGRDVLALVNYRGEIQKTIGVIEDYTSFLWSPNGKLAAISNTTGENPFEYKGLILVNSDGNLVNTLSTNTISSFFWSPDATKIIYSTRPNNNGIMSWMLLDIINNTESELIKFIPSDEFYVMMAFFDQYAYSHSVWSPDSKSVVFSGNIVDQSSMEPLDLPDTNIYVLDISSGDTHILDKGTFATWTNK